MTTPIPPSPPTPPVSGAGTLLGSNPLQQSIDRLNNTVGSLTSALSSLQQSISTNNGLGSGNNITSQQGPANTRRGFPSMVNPFRLGATTGGGNGGIGNLPSGGGTGTGVIAGIGALAGWGVNNSQNFVGLNSYATMSTIGFNYNGMSQSQAMRYMYGQVGATPGSQISIGTGSLSDNIGFAQTLQQRAGSTGIRQTAIGRAALGSAYAFGITNPNLTATSAASIASALYSPSLSYNMLTMGYNPILSQRPGGKPLNAGGAAMSILGAMGLGKLSSNQVFGNLNSGVGQANLSYLLQGTGITNQQMTQYLTDYAQLINNKGLTSSQATKLMTQAATGSAASMKSARNRLSALGISTANNDLASLVGNQAAVTGRAGDYADAFNRGLQDSAGLLTQFNTALNTLMHGPLGSLLGFGGGAMGTIAGSALGSGSNMLGTAGSYLLIKKLMAKSAGSAATSAAESAAANGGESLLARAAPGLAGAGLAGASTIGGAASLIGLLAKAELISGRSTGNYISGNVNLNNVPIFRSRFGPTGATMGGGAAGVSMGTSQQRTSGNNMTSVSGAAKKAVSAAESQQGVPYQYGAELPGVGFDCSALVQWAYKQAGVSLPRTSEQQWAALSKRSVPLDRVQEGDLVFTAGSDGSPNSPGHVGMMINSHQLIQAPRTGQNIQIVSYDPRGWSHAARPSGSGSFIAGTSGSYGQRGIGNTGIGSGIGGAYGSVNEVDVINAMGGYIGRGSGATNGTSGAKNTITGGSSGGSIAIPSGKASMVAIAKKIAASYGWGSGNQWNDFVRVENREAGWSLTAQNPTSSAYGVAQFIDGPSEYYQYGGNPNTAQGQFKAMFNYIKQRYGSPSGAWQHEKNIGWYGAGGRTNPGWAIVGDRGPELMYQGGGNQVFSNAQTMQLINAIKGSSPAQSPWKTDITSGGSSKPSAAPLNINFNQGSIVINSSGTSSQTATQAGREITRQIVKHLNTEAIHQAIRYGEKL